MKYQVSGDAQGLQQDPTHEIVFLLANYKCQPPKSDLPTVISVRMQLSSQAPNFNGMKALVSGSFNKDGTFEAQSISVPEIGFKARTTSWFSVVFLLLFGSLFASVGIFLSFFGSDPTKFGLIFLAAGIGVIAYGIYLLMGLIRNN